MGTINGTVAYGGKALSGGTITFMSKEFPEIPPCTFLINTDGTYTATEVPYGELMVSVVPAAVIGSANAASTAKAAMGQLDIAGQTVPLALMEATNPASAVAKQTETFPEKYLDPTSSGVVFTLDKPIAEFAVDLR